MQRNSVSNDQPLNEDEPPQHHRSVLAHRDTDNTRRTMKEPSFPCFFEDAKPVGMDNSSSFVISLAIRLSRKLAMAYIQLDEQVPPVHPPQALLLISPAERFRSISSSVRFLPCILHSWDTVTLPRRQRITGAVNARNDTPQIQSWSAETSPYCRLLDDALLFRRDQ
jgi:hypothetical protein